MFKVGEWREKCSTECGDSDCSRYLGFTQLLTDTETHPGPSQSCAGSGSGGLIMIRDTRRWSCGKSPVDTRQVQVDLLPHDLIYLLLIKCQAYCSIFTLCSLLGEMTDNLTSSIQHFSIKFFPNSKEDPIWRLISFINRYFIFRKPDPAVISI